MSSLFEGLTKAAVEAEDDYDLVASLSHEARVKCAEAKGCVVKYPAPNELFIDIDTPEQFATFERNLQAIERYLVVKNFSMTASSSGKPGRWHVVVTLCPEVKLSAIERIALQAALGSDPLRETLSLARVFLGEEHPTAFFEKADAP